MEAIQHYHQLSSCKVSHFED